VGDDLSADVRRLRADPDVVLLEGFHALKHALRFGATIELALAADPPATDALAAELAPDVQPALGEVLRPAAPEVMGIAVRRVPYTGVIAFARRPADGAAELHGGPVVLLENPRDLGNVGAVIRVAAAAGAAGVLTTGDQDPWDPRAIRGSAGLHFALPVRRVAPGTTDGRPLVAIDPDGDPDGLARIPAGAVLAFGTERHGLTAPTLAAACLRVAIPMRAGVSSLNLATAVAIVLYALIPSSPGV
jgi:RNA methyltransferase, TrmH family